MKALLSLIYRLALIAALLAIGGCEPLISGMILPKQGIREPQSSVHIELGSGR